MKHLLAFIALSLSLLSSCGYQSAEYKKLQAQNDSLMRLDHQMKEEIDSYFSAMNEIEQNIQKIKETQGILSVQPVGQEIDNDTRMKINNDLIYLNQLLQDNKNQLARLKAKLKNSAIKSQELERTIERLTKSLEEETQKVVKLETDIMAKDSLIAQLGSTVDTLKHDINKKQNKIEEQSTFINTGWYVVGTLRELKEQKIVTSGGIFQPKEVLKSDFNKDYFVRVDIRETKSIPLYTDHAKILTSHPKSSYTLDKDEDKNIVLNITDTKAFWSVSKYLVFQAD